MIYVMIANEAIYKRTDMKMKALKKTKHKINNVLNITVTFKHSLSFSVAVQWNDLDFQIFRFLRFSKYKNFFRKVMASLVVS